MDLGLKGLNALVTGGTKGIGRRAADIFAEEGANVSICSRNADEVKTTVAALAAREQGHRLAEVATILMQNLDLSAAEREYLVSAVTLYKALGGSWK